MAPMPPIASLCAPTPPTASGSQNKEIPSPSPAALNKARLLGGDFGAYINPDFHVEGAESGPLHGLKVALKDMYAVQGYRTGFGNPSWRATHGPATRTAPVVMQLLAAGASIAGLAHMDELAYSLNGENMHYGTPTNPEAPGHIPGGSSSGTAVAVAAGHTEIGLGSDTGGSVRLPASYCGVLSFRPSWGRVSMEGACNLAKTLDVAGWFTRDAALLKAVGEVLLGPILHPPDAFLPTGDLPSPSLSFPGPPPPEAAPTPLNTQPQAAPDAAALGSSPRLVRWLVGRDAFAQALPATAAALQQRLVPLTASLAAVLGSPPQEVEVAGSSPELQEAGLNELRSWAEVFRVCQAWEAWQANGAWVKEGHLLGPGIKERMEMAANVSQEEWRASCVKRRLIQRSVLKLLGKDGVLMLPSAPGPAPRCNTPAEELDDWRYRILSLTSIASLCGAPQVTLPFTSVAGLPIGLGFMGPPGSDERLLELAVQVMQLLQATPLAHGQGQAAIQG
ncbi:amidase [Haematococcus lacustris]